MIGFVTASPVRRRVTRESIAARTLALHPGLEVGSDEFAAAAVLVAGSEVGHNIDRIARLTGVDRENVARMARRLVDNGVWVSGNTVSHWRDNPGDVVSFRRDVAVAEGRLCRRMDEFGQLEWAPQGYWRKEFEYAGAKADLSSHAVRYHPHVAVPESECLYVPDEEVQEEDGPEALDSSAPVRAEAEVSREAQGLRRQPPSAPEDAPVWLGGEVRSPEPEDDEGDGWALEVPGALGGAEAGAVWLGWEGAVPQRVGD